MPKNATNYCSINRLKIKNSDRDCSNADRPECSDNIVKQFGMHIGFIDIKPMARCLTATTACFGLSFDA
jgi:hypothetical protein